MSGELAIKNTSEVVYQSVFFSGSIYFFIGSIFIRCIICKVSALNAFKYPINYTVNYFSNETGFASPFFILRI